MNGVLFVVLVALGLGVAIGKWWEHDRVGGTLDLADHVDRLETELETEQLDNAVLRGERDQRRASSMYGAIRTSDRLDPRGPAATVWPVL